MDVNVVVQQAVDAFPDWSARPVEERAEILRVFADLVDLHADELVGLIVGEVGKRAVEARGEVEWTALSARWYADNPPRSEQVAEALVVRRPVGVVAAITPWNVPLVTPAWKWLPALVAGNTVVWKPSERAHATAARATELLLEAGLPAGVLALVPGGPAEAMALAAHEDVAVVHFTGSTAAGRAISAAVAARQGRCALELGGSNPAIVFDDADLAAAADAIVAAATSINGQKCTSTRRVLVERGAAGELTDLLTTRIESLRLGDPSDPETDVGPLIGADARERADAAVAALVAGGARVVARAPAPAGEGLAFFRPTLLEGADTSAHEIFAPVLTLAPFDGEDEAWRLANASPFGLAAALFTADPARARRGLARLRSGIVTVNRRGDAVGLEPPFGGLGASGNGRPEGGHWVYDSLTDIQSFYSDSTGGS